MTASIAFIVLPTLSTAGEDWTGFYAGAQLGGSGGAISIDGISEDISVDAGWSYGLHAGYNANLANNMVVGAELSYDRAQNSLEGVVDVDVDTTRLKFKAGSSGGETLLYGVLGVVNGAANYGALDEAENGVTFGFGGSRKMKNNLILSS